MNAELILTGVQFVAMTVSFILLHRARRLSTKLWSTGPSYWRLPIKPNIEQPALIEQLFRV
jgi:hypothetical protein